MSQDPSETPQVSQSDTQDPSETPQVSQSDTPDPSETPQVLQSDTPDPSETPQVSQSDSPDPQDTPESTSAGHKEVVKPTNPNHVTPTSQLSNLNPTTSDFVYSSNTRATLAPSAEPQSQQDTTQVFENLAASSDSESGTDKDFSLSHGGEGPLFEEGDRSSGGHVPEHIEKWRRDEKAHKENSSKQAPQRQDLPEKENEELERSDTDTHPEDIGLDHGQRETVKEAWKPADGSQGDGPAAEHEGVTGGLEEGEDEGVVSNLEGEDEYRREEFGGTVNENSATDGVGIQDEDRFKQAATAEFPDGGGPPNSSRVSEEHTETVPNYQPMETNKMESPTPERPSEPPPPSPEEEEDGELPFGEFVDEDELRTITLKSGEQGKIYLDHGGRATIAKDNGDRVIVDYDYLSELGVDDDRFTYLEDLDLENFDYDTYMYEDELEDVDRMMEREVYYESGLPEPPPQFLPPKLDDDDDDDVTSSERDRSGQRDYLNFEAIRERLLQEQAKKGRVDQEDTLDHGSNYHDIETPQGPNESHPPQEHEKILEHVPLEDFSQPPVFSAAFDKDELEFPRDKNKDEWELPEPEPPTFQPEELPSPPPQYEDQEESGVCVCVCVCVCV